MRRSALLVLFALVSACAQPLVRPVTGPAPADAGVSVPTALSNGPDGESPPLNGASPRSKAPAVEPPPVPVVSEDRLRDISRLRDKHLIVPVAGVSPEKLEDSFTAPRDGERVHRAIDILAPRNTPILAADDGVILRMSSNTLGGITIFATDADRQFVYYYAHLDHYDGRIHEGQSIKKGETLGYVGTTGDAPKDVPHLHFQIMKWPSDGKYWVGEPINPYPILHQSR
jgi:murein DD-endopeptidase MepM/ murein hydrolase activator NlpD